MPAIAICDQCGKKARLPVYIGTLANGEYAAPVYMAPSFWFTAYSNETWCSIVCRMAGQRPTSVQAPTKAKG